MLFFSHNKSLYLVKRKYVTPMEFKNTDKLICYKHVTPNGVSENRCINVARVCIREEF
jgi:hypothetical protein